MSETDSPPHPAAMGPLIQTARWLSWCVGGLSTLLPGASFFTQGAPPLFAPTGLLTSGVAVAVWIGAYLRPVSGKRALSQGIWLLVLAAVAGAAYVYSLDYLTVQAPGGRSSEHFQIGFGTAPWSLTAEARALMANPENDLQTPVDLMLAMAAFPGGTGERSQIWNAWSIALAGSTLICLFLGGFLSLAGGFGKLARSLSVATKKQPEPKETETLPHVLTRFVKQALKRPAKRKRK